MSRSLADLVRRGETEHRVADRRRRSVCSREGLEAELRLSFDGDRRFIAVRDGDLAPIDSRHSADQPCKLSERAALLALEDRLERAGLVVAGGIDDEADRPVDGSEVRGEVVVEGGGGAGQIGAVEIAFLDVEDERAQALTVCTGGGPVDGARADSGAVTDCDVRAGNSIRHWIPLRRRGPPCVRETLLRFASSRASPRPAASG